MATKTITTKWFKYHQNNSGGVFCKPAINVFVEAMDTDQADSIAEGLGLYFDGSGDCSCCGSRWSPASNYDASEEEPTLETDRYGLYKNWAERDGVPEAIKMGLGDVEPVVLTRPTK